jgi:hypothetical protein
MEILMTENFSFLSIVIYDDTYIRASIMIPRTGSAGQNGTFFGYLAGNVFSIVITAPSDNTSIKITQNSPANLNCIIRGVRI